VNTVLPFALAIMLGSLGADLVRGFIRWIVREWEATK
jgi:hypothetical protein